MLLRMPTSFLPDEDQGILFAQVVLPAGATQERTLKVLRELERHFLVDEKDTVAGALHGRGLLLRRQRPERRHRVRAAEATGRSGPASRTA